MIHDPTHPKTREELEDALARLETPRVGGLFGAAGLASFLTIMGLTMRPIVFAWVIRTIF